MRPTLLGVALLSLVAACASQGTQPPQCIPNETRACSCVGGGVGVQSCEAAGDAFSACACDAADAGTTTPSVDAGTPDAGALDGGISPPPIGDGPLAATELLSRPTDTSMTVSVVAGEALEAYAEATPVGSAGSVVRTVNVMANVGDVAVMTWEGLTPATEYDFRVFIKIAGATSYTARPAGRFRTAPPSGSTFTFTIQADSHLDEKSSLALYQRTLQNVVEDTPDFHIDLGDTFMTEKHSAPFQADVVPAPDRPTVVARYLFERGNFGLLGLSVPLLLVNGNHEGESGWRNKGSENGALWASLARKEFFPNPVAGSFISSPNQDVPLVGVRESAWAFTWGDALIIGLDPYWWTNDKKAGGENWGWTLGEAQYRWLAQTLRSSTARYKMVFLHHLVGGSGGANRGGAEAAGLYEWGGKGADGLRAFETKRPGWDKTIHELLVESHATAVFHGHDHLYVHQEMDGVAYVEVPQPSNPNGTNFATLAAEGGYTSGTKLGSSGHLRVTVSPTELKCDYVRAWTEGVRERIDNRSVAHSWTMPPAGVP